MTYSVCQNNVAIEPEQFFGNYYNFVNNDRRKT